MHSAMEVSATVQQRNDHFIYTIQVWDRLCFPGHGFIYVCLFPSTLSFQQRIMTLHHTTQNSLLFEHTTQLNTI